VACAALVAAAGFPVRFLVRVISGLPFLAAFLFECRAIGFFCTTTITPPRHEVNRIMQKFLIPFRRYSSSPPVNLGLRNRRARGFSGQPSPATILSFGRVA
jgi:hypothetical protein